MNSKLKISITGKNPEHLLKEIIKKKINIYALEKEKKKISIIINREDYEEIMSIKTASKIKIVQYYGLAKCKYLLKKYSIFIIFLIMGIMINIILSHLIFKIEVIHSNQELVQTITKDLNDLGLKKYHFKVSYKRKEKIKEALLEKEKDLLEWLEIEEKGTKYIVKVEQRKKNNQEEVCKPRHIIAKKNALITNISANAGEIVKKKNDYVSKGEVLISGLIHNKDKIVSKKCASGSVYGEVWYKVKLTIPKIYITETKTKEEKLGITLTFFNHEYNFLNKYRTFQKKEYNLIEGKISPLNIGLSKYIKTNKKIKKLTLTTVDPIAIQLASKQIKKELKEEESIISKKVLKKSENNSKIKVEVFFKVKENITTYKDISNLNIEEMNQEKE